MKKYFKNIYIVALCIAMLFCLTSCLSIVDYFPNNEESQSETTNNEESQSEAKDDFTFDSVKALHTAIKREPYKYNGQQVKVSGIILKDDAEHIVVLCDIEDIGNSNSDFSAFKVQYLIWELKEVGTPHFEVNMSDDLQYAVLESGDYVQLSGVVSVADGKVYLNRCKYSLITTP